MARGGMRLCAAFVMLVALGEVQAQRILAAGFEESCLVDTDGDRLMNCQEAARQTSLTDPDTDDDGLSDGDEVLLTPDGLNLAAFGVNPRHKDLLIEHDWQDDNVDPEQCGPHTHNPDPDTIAQLRLAFAAAPVPNPDGGPGINLIQDVGQGGLFTGGNFVNVAGALIIGGASAADFQNYKAQNFASNRLGYFHYVINTHRYSSNPLSSCTAEVVGADFLVTMACSFNEGYIRNTIMHELGHNLGLQHGGGTGCNQKPNYNSVMNYRWQFDGIDTNCNLNPDDVMNYSIGARAPLD